MTDNFNIYNFNGVIISYYKNIDTIIYHLKLYIKNTIDFTNNIVIITNPYNKNVNLDFIQNKNIFILVSEINFDLFFKLHILRNNYLYKNNITEYNSIVELYNKLNVSYNSKYVNELTDSLNIVDSIIDYVKLLDTENIVYDEIYKKKNIEDIPYYNELLNNIHEVLNTNINNFKFDFKQYASMYIFKSCNLIIIECKSKMITLEDVYYIKKQWFDKDKMPLIIKDFYADFEYKYIVNHYENQNQFIDEFNITNHPNYQEIKEEVMFLDYIYGFYNFGEFWDCIKRLMVSNIKNIPLFHMNHNRITDIQYYFDKLNFNSPTQYQKSEREDKLYYFHKIHISTITQNIWRGKIEQSFAYEFNKLFNQSEKTEKTFNIYLARGKYGRSIINEEQIVNILKDKYNFIVLNGSETLQDTIHYFTNSKIILGAHGSLMKNIIWAKSNPILIELCPSSRHACFRGNAIDLGFLPMYILTESNDKEQLVLNDNKLDNLYSLLDILCIN
jgi:hypothetical protein